MKVKTTTETEIEVMYPQYRKYGGTIHKITSDKNYIGVKVDEEYNCIMSEYKIEIMNGYERSTAGIFTEGTEVSEACFNNAFQKALSQINGQILAEEKSKEIPELSYVTETVNLPTVNIFD